MVYWVFSLSHRPIEQVLTGKIPMALAEADRGNITPLKELYGSYDSFRFLEGGYKLGGWYFDLRPYCKKYWIKLRDGGIFEGYAPNKTCIRKVYGDYWVDQIVEVKERRTSYVPRYAHV